MKKSYQSIENDINLILDKINDHGINSLTINEKECLDNPENPCFGYRGSNTIQNMILELTKKGIIKPVDVSLYEDGFELYGLSNKKFKRYFEEYGYIYIQVETDGFAQMLIIGEDETDYENESKLVTKERYGLFKYLQENIEKCDMLVEFNDEVYLEHMF